MGQWQTGKQDEVNKITCWIPHPDCYFPDACYIQNMIPSHFCPIIYRYSLGYFVFSQCWAIYTVTPWVVCACVHVCGSNPYICVMDVTPWGLSLIMANFWYIYVSWEAGINSTCIRSYGLISTSTLKHLSYTLWSFMQIFYCLLGGLNYINVFVPICCPNVTSGLYFSISLSGVSNMVARCIQDGRESG